MSKTTAVELKNKIYWVGAVDYDVRDFHGYMTPQGTTYNAYLILDRKIALVDTVKKNFSQDLLTHVRSLIDPSVIDYLIINHVEMDHSGSVVEMVRHAPRAKIVTTSKGQEGLIKHFGLKDREYVIVKTGDTLSLGGRTLRFIAAPMIHWPDTMFTYVVEDQVLLPNDGFGQHLAHPYRFADEVGEDVCMEAAAKYYANILMPLGNIIAKKLEEIEKSGVAIDMIGPSHGAIWRKNISRILTAYKGWTQFASTDKIVIVYDTMWETTEMMAKRLAEIFAAASVDVKIYKIRNSDGSQIVRDVLDAKVVLFGSPTLNADMFWTVGGFLTYLRGLKPKNKKVGIFGSYGWSEAASKMIRRDVETMGLEMIEPPFEVQYVPTQEEMEKLDDYGRRVLESLKSQ